MPSILGNIPNAEPPSELSKASVRELIGAEVLLIDRDTRVQKGLMELLRAAELHVTCVSDPAEAWGLLDRHFFSVAVIDVDTPSPGGGIEAISTIKLMSPTSMVVALTPRKSFEVVVQAVRAGAEDVIFKEPSSIDYLRDRVLAAAGHSADERQIDSILEDVSQTHDAFLKELLEANRRVLDLEDKVSGVSRESDQTSVNILVVGNDDSMVRMLSTPGVRGFRFTTAFSGGQALDLCGSRAHPIVMVGSDLQDLPTSMVIRSIQSQFPDILIMAFSPPGPNGKIEIVEPTRSIPVVAEWTDKRQFYKRLPELGKAFKLKAEEARYTMAFRERHYTFLRKFVALKNKINRALSE